MTRKKSVNDGEDLSGLNLRETKYLVGFFQDRLSFLTAGERKTRYRDAIKELKTHERSLR